MLFVYVPPRCPSPQDASLGGELWSGAADAVDRMEDQSLAHIRMDMNKNYLDAKDQGRITSRSTDEGFARLYTILEAGKSSDLGR